MVQWTKLQWIKKFVNPTRLYITYGKSGGLHLAELGLTAGRQSGRQNSGENLKLVVDQNIQFFVLFNKGTALFKHF